MARRTIVRMAPLRLADLLASVSLLSDLGFGLPPEESMRSTIIATALARRIGVDEQQVSSVYYTTLLQHVGCPGFAHETAAVYGNELIVNEAAARVGDDLGDVIDTLLRAVVRGRGPLGWSRVALYTLLRGDRFGRDFAITRCEVGRETARRLGLREEVQRGLHEVAESWDGRSGPLRLRGEEIAVAARIASVAATAARFDALGGEQAVVAVLSRRSGGQLDPTCVAAFRRHATELLAAAHTGDPRDAVLDAEPTPVQTIPEADLPAVTAAVGDVADLKSTYTLGHAAGVTGLAVAAGERAGLDDAGRARLRIAAHLHDIGRVGVTNAIWDKGGPLSAAEWEAVRLHPYHTERIMARSDGLRPMAQIAGTHHERLDGSGYYRGSRGRDLSLEGRILAAADVFQAWTQDRPHRPAVSPEEAAERVGDEVLAGRIDPDAASSVIEAGGVSSAPRVRTAIPGGLSQREVEVLRLVAHGLTNRQIATRLVVSPRTAEHHVQHIYTKIGASSRAAAALFAMEHDLLD